MNRKVIVADDVASMNRRAAKIMGEKARQAIAERGRFTLTVGGGSSVREPYSLFAAEPGIDWSEVFLFWGDDRFVEHDNPYSNYTLVREALIAKLPSLPPANVFPVPVDAPTPREGARRYSATIREFFDLAEGELPRFDLCQNGMGPDGHTGSIFPHASTRSKDIAHMAHAGLKPWVDRVTFGMPVFNNARCVLFIATGAAKAEVLKEVLEGEPSIKQRPSHAVRPTDGEVIWLLEPEIARLLDGK